MRIKLFLMLPVLLYVVQAQLLDTSQHILSRKKRWLIWSDKGPNWVQFIFGLGIPLEVKGQAITLGTVMKAFYLLPTNTSVYTRPSIDIARRKRSTSRWRVYEALENFLERYHYGDGRACILRSICEVSHAPLDSNSGILAEIVSAVLTPSTTNDPFEHHTNVEYLAAEKLGRNMENCERLFPECGTDFLQQFSKFAM
ncbi:unnamed protein product [Acanthoscelides obtectus]|uniref:Uncharacterized protein n=1 Tax=Acanthoscelides obtectus TaxID=200917 RepID=A0A9P0PA11_ACAOB|nr:unnamed protein product [Acanthoscelides obtectus]CAK1664786.1 hypothetical protein AOBTE_LOCUS24463 [Acanthoscelides obtectus]